MLHLKSLALFLHLPQIPDCSVQFTTLRNISREVVSVFIAV